MNKIRKKICKTCYRQSLLPWTSDTEMTWKEGYISCPHELIGDKNISNKRYYNLLTSIFGFIEVKSEPPRWCPYIIEQVVSRKR